MKKLIFFVFVSVFLFSEAGYAQASETDTLVVKPEKKLKYADASRKQKIFYSDSSSTGYKGVKKYNPCKIVLTYENGNLKKAIVDYIDPKKGDWSFTIIQEVSYNLNCDEYAATHGLNDCYVGTCISFNKVRSFVIWNDLKDQHDCFVYHNLREIQ